MTIRRYESSGEPPIQRLKKISEIFDVPMSEFICEKKENTNDTQDKLEIKIEINGYNPDLFIEKLDKYLSTLLRKDT